MTRDEKDAGNALSFHVYERCRQTRHPAFEGTDGIFLTDKYAQRLLRAVGARNTGIKAAATAIKTMQARGWMVDTGTTKKPRRSQTSSARAEKFQPHGVVAGEGGKDAQPPLARSYWWRVFRVPVSAWTRGRIVHGPQRPASLSAFLDRQGLIPRPRHRRWWQHTLFGDISGLPPPEIPSRGCGR